MSLILDALNRAERERNKTASIPDLQTVHEAAPVTEVLRKNHRRTAYAIALSGLIILACVAGYLISRQYILAENLQSTAVSLLAAQSPALTSPAAVSATTEKVSESEPRTPAAQEVAPISSVSSSSVADLAALYASARDHDQLEERKVDKLYQAPPVPAPSVASQAVTPDVSDSPQMPAQVPARSGRTYTTLIDLPDIGDLPWNLRQQIPTINYVRHNFTGASGGERSSVVMNGRAYYVGDHVAADVLLEDIIEDGVILRFKQTRFKLRALNSWINM